MTNEEKVLFCRIAVHNKLVSLEDANACMREAKAAKVSVGKVFVDKGLLSEDQVKQIARAVGRRLASTRQAPARQGAPREAGPPQRARRSGEGRRRREPPVRKQDTSQLVLTIVSLVVILVVVVVLVVLWQRTSEPTTTPTSAKGPASSQGPKAGPVVSGPEGSAPPTTPEAPPPLSEEEKQEIERACNEALSDAMMSLTMDSMGPHGIASLDNFLKKYGPVASAEQKGRIEESRGRLLGAIKAKFEEDKKRLLEANQANDTAGANDVLRDIEQYADQETIKEARALLGTPQ